MKLHASNPFRFSVFTLTVLLAASSLHAADGTWNGITGNWTDTTDPGGVWSGGTIADGMDSTAFFTGADIVADQTITLNGNRTIGNITFTDATTSSHNLTITGNTLTLDRTAPAIPNIDVTQAARQLSISSLIAGNDGVQKNGTGTLRLASTIANTFTGGLTINSGTVYANSNVNVLGGGKVTIGDVANTGAAAELLYIGVSANTAFNNAIDVRGNGTATIRVHGYNPTFSGAINLGNNLTVISNNNFGSNIGFSGGVTGTGNLVIQSNAANGTADSFISFSGATVNMIGSITNSGTTTSATDSHTTISAVIGTNVTGITQNSANSNLILTGANSFTSNILVSSGTLQANLSSPIANPTTGSLGNAQTPMRTATISSGATLRFGVSNVLGNGGSTPNLKIIANGGTILHAVNNDINSIGPVELNGGNLSSTGTGTTAGFKLTGTVTVGGSAVSTISASSVVGSNSLITYNVADAVAGSGTDLNVTAVVADIFGSGGIIKTGAGTMTLTAQNTFTGGTQINNGTLALGHATNTLPASPVSIGAGTLDTGTVDDTVGTLDVTGAATIKLGTGSNLAFAASNGVDWTGGTLNLTGTLNFSGGPSSSLRFGTSNAGLLPAQLLQITSAGWTAFALDVDGYLTATPSGGNTDPTISDIANQSVPSGGNTGALPFTVGDAETPVGSLTLSVSANDNTTLIPNANIVFGGSGANRTVTLTPVSGLTGSATITVRVTDGGALFDEDTFTLTVTPNYVSWAASQVPPVTGGVNGDDDNDGVNNLVEYALVDGGERGVLAGNTITFTKRAGVYGTDLTYVIETSETLASGSWTDEVTHGPGLIMTNPTISYNFTPSTPVKEFARLKVTGP